MRFPSYFEAEQALPCLLGLSHGQEVHWASESPDQLPRNSQNGEFLSLSENPHYSFLDKWWVRSGTLKALYKPMTAEKDTLREGTCAGGIPDEGSPYLGSTPSSPAHLVAPSSVQAGLFWLTSADSAPVPLSLKAPVEGTAVPLGTG